MSGHRKPWEHAKAGGSEADELAVRFVESLSFDRRLYAHDIAGSLAHARMLRHVELIGDRDLAEIERGLEEIRAEIQQQGDAWPGWKTELEDVHMCIEAALIEKIGEPGRKLHTGRSRNDQVATDLKLWMRDATGALERRFTGLFAALVELAQRDGDMVIPSYTHWQRAQPVTVGGELIGWLTALDGCLTRLLTLGAASSGNPLGSGAIAGSALPLDREHTAEALGIGAPTASSMEATASRDAGVDFVYALSMTATWLSRWAEQWIVYMSAEFGFLDLGDAYTTGSSMMPQKRNPDMLELIRARAGEVQGHLTAMLTLCKGLHLGYNRDLQDDKRHVFSAFDTVRDALEMAERIVRSARFHEQRIRDGLDRGYLDATSLAEYLVTRGVAFRTAHQIVAALVQRCEQTGRSRLQDLPVEQMNETAAETLAAQERDTPPDAAGSPEANLIGEDVYDWLGPDNVVRRYRTYGNAGLSGYREQLARWQRRLGEDAPGPTGGGDGTPAPGLFGDPAELSVTEQDRALIEAYKQQGRTLDDLPYTDAFEAIYRAAAGGRTRQQVFHRLHNLRKAGKLPALGRSPTRPPRLSDEQRDLARQLALEHVDRLSLRDQLPFTESFDRLVERFNTETGLELSRHQLWRVVATLAK